MSRDPKFYITTAIDYVNDKPHLGHALEKIQADVLARYARLKYGADNVWFLTGTDEHGVKVQRAAEKSGKDTKKFVNEISAKFEGLKKSLDLSYDQFIRTTDEKTHYPGAIKIWNKLLANGDLEKRIYRGLYCVGHEAFVTEKDLVEGLCADHGREPEIIEEENWFFLLSKYTGAIKGKIQSGEMQILPETRRNEILALLERGLEDVSFSRPKKSLVWGIPVPNDPEQTMYVWTDALTNYISAIGYGREEDNFNKWWPADVQVIGKDILRFHAAIWPAMLLSAGLKLPKKLLVHGFITADGRKMSKTVGNVIDPVEISKKYGADALRYYLLKEIPSGEDGDFSMEKFTTLYNSDLANGIGNLTARVLKMAADSNVHLSNDEIFSLSNWISRDPHAKAIEGFIENFQLSRALENLLIKPLEIEPSEEVNVSEGINIKVVEAPALATLSGTVSVITQNVFIQNEQPFKEKDNEVKKEKIRAELLRLYKVAIWLTPFLPETAEKIKTAIENHQVPPILFPRI